MGGNGKILCGHVGVRKEVRKISCERGEAGPTICRRLAPSRSLRYEHGAAARIGVKNSVFHDRVRVYGSRQG